MSTPAPHGSNPFAGSSPASGAPAHASVPQQGGQNPFAGGAALGGTADSAAAQDLRAYYANSTSAVICAVCGAYPAAEANFRAHRGMVIAMSNAKVEGPFCRDCGTRAFQETQNSNMLKGWWSLGSLVVNPAILVWNAIQHRKVAKLAAPAPGGPRTPLAPGKPLHRRPVFALAVLFPVVVVSVIVAVVLSSGDDVTGANAGDCVRNTGTDSNPTVDIVACTGPDAEYLVLERLDGTTSDAMCPTLTSAALTYDSGGDKFVLCMTEASSLIRQPTP
ncbi:LppU/SCO3897 family protein [Yinghuangia soli]|uniref:Uncharacterized protein n=1 Tax=Yinghuangia soli TaxID=2908204 RepID=A0AA41Q773_9ACTN|nr:hypothetical protein [Yinghuangia soli]MCF2532778.1 hypothetical protein [Yinghuangia soli]